MLYISICQVQIITTVDVVLMRYICNVINWGQVVHLLLASHPSKILVFSQTSISHQTISTSHHPRWIKL
jgi:hypothetical protein